MSQVYSKEPNTTGQVVLNTTCGPIEIHLFCKECPTTTKAFIQSCLDGYYDNLPFHRVLDNVLIQTGQREIQNNVNINDETYNNSFHGMWEQSEERDKYETISRIQFNHRGQVALARSIKMSTEEKVSLRGQFFITLDSTPWLNNEHVILGTVGTSPTIFNALRIGRSIVIDEKSNPTPIDLDSVKIINVSVKSNLFENELVPNLHVPWREKKNDEAAVAAKKKDKKRKKLLSKKNVNVLSFGDEEDGMDDDYEVSALKKKSAKKMKSIHDISEAGEIKEEKTDAVEEIKDIPNSNDSKDDANQHKDISTIELNVTDKDVGEYKKEVPNRKEQELNQGQEEVDRSLTTKKSNQDAKSKHSSTKQKQDKKEDISGIVEARRSKYINSTKSHRRGDKKAQSKNDKGDDIINKLSAFRNRIIEAKSSKQQPQQAAEEYKGQILEKSDDEDDKNTSTKHNWMKSKFSNCKKHIDHESKGYNNAKRDSVDDYVVIDEKRKGRDDDHHRHRKHDKSHRKRW